MLTLQVDCAGVSLLMTGSPHTSMPNAIHHFKPRPLAGVFYVQDERLCTGCTVHRGRRKRRSGASQFGTLFVAGKRRSGASQFCTAYLDQHGRQGGVCQFCTLHHIQPKPFMLQNTHQL